MRLPTSCTAARKAHCKISDETAPPRLSGHSTSGTGPSHGQASATVAKQGKHSHPRSRRQSPERPRTRLADDARNAMNAPASLFALAGLRAQAAPASHPAKQSSSELLEQSDANVILSARGRCPACDLQRAGTSIPGTAPVPMSRAGGALIRARHPPARPGSRASRTRAPIRKRCRACRGVGRRWARGDPGRALRAVITVTASRRSSRVAVDTSASSHARRCPSLRRQTHRAHCQRVRPLPFASVGNRYRPPVCSDSGVAYASASA